MIQQIFLPSKIVLFAFIFIGSISVSYAQIFVKANANGTNNGNSWTNAY